MVRFVSSRCGFGCGLAFPLFGQVRMAVRMKACLSVMRTMKAGSLGKDSEPIPVKPIPAVGRLPFHISTKKRSVFGWNSTCCFFLEDQDLRATCLFWGVGFQHDLMINPFWGPY